MSWMHLLRRWAEEEDATAHPMRGREGRRRPFFSLWSESSKCHQTPSVVVSVEAPTTCLLSLSLNSSFSFHTLFPIFSFTLSNSFLKSMRLFPRFGIKISRFCLTITWYFKSISGQHVEWLLQVPCFVSGCTVFGVSFSSLKWLHHLPDVPSPLAHDPLLPTSPESSWFSSSNQLFLALVSF